MQWSCLWNPERRRAGIAFCLMEALTDLSLPLVVSFSTTRIKPLWIVERLYCDFLEMCLVLWWRPLCKHHWYDLPFWQTSCLLCMFKGLSLQNDSLVTIDCVSPALPDWGFLGRIFWWHQACMLDERRITMEVFSENLNLSQSNEHQPVLSHHHSSTG